MNWLRRRQELDRQYAELYVQLYSLQGEMETLERKKQELPMIVADKYLYCERKKVDSALVDIHLQIGQLQKEMAAIETIKQTEYSMVCEN